MVWGKNGIFVQYTQNLVEKKMLTTVHSELKDEIR